MTDPNTRVTRLVLMGTQYKVVSAKVSDFDKMAASGNVKMIAQWSGDCKAWVYFDGETRPPFRFEELA